MRLPLTQEGKKKVAKMYIDLNILIISWRGFSGNKGKPTEKNLYHDAQEAVKWLKAQGLDNKNIILYGESLGTGVATELASKNNFGGIILESLSLIHI